MQNLLFSINVVLPLFLCCFIGYMAKRLHLVDDGFLSGCSHLVFYISIPANIFMSIVDSNLKKSFSFSLLLFLFCVISILFILLVLLVPRIVKDQKLAASIAICLFRGNFAMLGVPLAQSLMGEQGATVTLVMIPFGTLLYTILTVTILVIVGQDRTGSPIKTIQKTSAEVIRNPLIIASMLGIMFAYFKLPIPLFVHSTIGYFADTCTGLALFMLGAQLTLSETRERLRYTIPVIIGRLFVIPAVVLCLAALLGFRGDKMACIFIFFAAPSAVNCYILADRMGGDGKLAGDTVLLGTCASTLSLLLGICILKSLHLL